MLVVDARPTATLIRPPAADKDLTPASMRAVSCASTRTAPAAWTCDWLSMKAEVSLSIVFFAVAAPPLTLTLPGAIASAAAAATVFEVMRFDSIALSVTSPMRATRASALPIDACTRLAMVFSASATPTDSEAAAPPANEMAIEAAPPTASMAEASCADKLTEPAAMP